MKLVSHFKAKHRKCESLTQGYLHNEESSAKISKLQSGTPESNVGVDTALKRAYMITKESIEVRFT